LKAFWKDHSDWLNETLKSAEKKYDLPIRNKFLAFMQKKCNELKLSKIYGKGNSGPVA